MRKVWLVEERQGRKWIPLVTYGPLGSLVVADDNYPSGKEELREQQKEEPEKELRLTKYVPEVKK